jgi:prepilin peptidase CpaA
MPGPLVIAYGALLIPLAVIITYYDVRYRRIPNAFVLATLLSGVIINSIFGGATGALASLGGCGLAFILMFVMHVFGAMGAGDVKLFAAIGSVTGAAYVLPMFLIVILTGGLLAVVLALRGRAVRSTALRVMQILVGLMPGWQMPRFAVPADKRLTIPYGVAITFGSIITLAVVRA